MSSGRDCDDHGGDLLLGAQEVLLQGVDLRTRSAAGWARHSLRAGTCWDRAYTASEMMIRLSSSSASRGRT